MESRLCSDCNKEFDKTWVLIIEATGEKFIVCEECLIKNHFKPEVREAELKRYYQRQKLKK